MTSELAGAPLVLPPGCPAHDGAVPIYGADFAADPYKVYEHLRQYGPVARVEIAPNVPVTLVLDYDLALEVLRSPDTFVRDPRSWKGEIAPDSPVLPDLGYRPNCLFSDGAYHARLRGAVTDSLRRADAAMVREQAARSADTVIDRFCGVGEADLIPQFARVVPLLTLSQLFGCPPLLSEQLLRIAIFDGSSQAEQAHAELSQCLLDLVTLKRRHPGVDVTSWLAAHPAGLTDEELVHQLIMFMGAGCEPEQNLMANSLRLLLSDDRFAGDLSGGGLQIEDAIDEVLWTDPPVANFAMTYPVREVELGGTTIPASDPVVVSFSAANNDRALPPEQRAGNRAHLAWGAGAHTCPAQQQARQVASVTLERLLDRLPELELAVPPEHLVWRAGPFHRALTALPVRFPAIRPPAAAEQGTQNQWAAGRPLPPPPPAAPPRAEHAAETPMAGGWFGLLMRWWRGQ